MRNSKIALLTLLFLLAVQGCKHQSDKIIGIKIYEYDEDFLPLVIKWKDMGINTAFISSKLAANEEFRILLKDNQIETFIIFPVFNNPDFLRNDTLSYAITNTGRIAKESWVEFVCPSRKAYRKNKINEAAELVRNLKPDGLSVDFIRQFVFWEMIYPESKAESIEMTCFCDSCIVDFCNDMKISVPDSCLSVKQKSAFILNHHFAEWNDFRSELIASMAREIADIIRDTNPDIKVNIHAVPWRDEDFDGANIRIASQDLKKLALVADFISPMCYTQMLRRDAGWIESVVNEMDRKAPGIILPSIQVYSSYIDDPFSLSDFRDCYKAALKGPSQGVIFFSYSLYFNILQVIRNRHQRM